MLHFLSNKSEFSIFLLSLSLPFQCLLYLKFCFNFSFNLCTMSCFLKSSIFFRFCSLCKLRLLSSQFLEKINLCGISHFIFKSNFLLKRKSLQLLFLFLNNSFHFLLNNSLLLFFFLKLFLSSFKSFFFLNFFKSFLLFLFSLCNLKLLFSCLILFSFLFFHFIQSFSMI